MLREGTGVKRSGGAELEKKMAAVLTNTPPQSPDSEEQPVPPLPVPQSLISQPGTSRLESYLESI